MCIYTKCLHCSKQTKNPKFCSRSCNTSYNNKGVRRHGKEKGLCAVCNKPKKRAKSLTCSNKCATIWKKENVWATAEEQKAKKSEAQSRYRAKKYRVISEDADPNKIREFYKNRPEGYEVDHIIPLSKGGKHHEDNLQYLTKEENRKKGSKLVDLPRFELRS